MFKLMLAGLALLMPVAANAQPAPAVKREVILPQGTPIALVLAHGVSAKSAQSGDRVVLRTLRPVVHSGKIIIPEGTPVLGAVARVTGSRGGRAADIVIEAEAIVLEAGGRIALDGVLARQGQDYQRQVKGGGGPMVGGSMTIPLGRRNVSPNLEAGTVFLARTEKDF